MCDIGVIFQNITENHNLFPRFEIIVNSQRQDSLPTYIHIRVQLISDNWETKSWVHLVAFLRNHNLRPFNLLNPSRQMWRLHVWNILMMATHVKLHDFRGLYVLRLGGYWKRVCWLLNLNTWSLPLECSIISSPCIIRCKTIISSSSICYAKCHNVNIFH